MGMKPSVYIVSSHKTHMVIGLRVCGFYNREIDALIDESREEDAGEEESHELVIPLSSIPDSYLVIEGDVSGRRGHDASRVSCSVLLSQAHLVLEKFGDRGLCYYILHHYLDKFINILRGQILNLYSKYKDRENAFDLVYGELISSLNEIVRRGYETEASTFKALELILDKGFKDAYEDAWKALINALDLNADYKSGTRSTKSAIIIAKTMNTLRKSHELYYLVYRLMRVGGGRNQQLIYTSGSLRINFHQRSSIDGVRAVCARRTGLK